jgi:hypothetical protein
VWQATVYLDRVAGVVIPSPPAVLALRSPVSRASIRLHAPSDCPGIFKVRQVAGKHQANASRRKGAEVALLQRGLLPQFRADHKKHAQVPNKENLIPIKALPSQKRKTA